jgi:hypothetical protein
VLPRRPSVAFFAGAETNTRNYAALNSLTLSCSVFFASTKIMLVLFLKNSGPSNVGKAGWNWVVSQRLIPEGKQSGLRMRTATTESVSLCTRMKN